MGLFDCGQPLFRDFDRDQIRVREITIVVGLLLGAHRTGPAGIRVPEQGLLDHLAAFQQDIALAVLFIFEGPQDITKGVHVLELGPGAELLLDYGA